MMIPGNAGFGPLQVTYIEEVSEDIANDIASTQVLNLMLVNIVGYTIRDFFVFRPPYPGKVLSGNTVVTGPFANTNLTVKIRKGGAGFHSDPPIFVEIDNGTMVIQPDDSGLGANASCTPDFNNSFEAGEFISVEIDGGEKIDDADVSGTVSLVFERASS